MSYDFADFLVYTWGYGDVAKNPRYVGQDQRFHWRENGRAKSKLF
jgi:hypothetical protein